MTVPWLINLKWMAVVPLAKKRTSRDRVNFTDSLSQWEIRKLVKDRDLRVLQFAEPVDQRTLDHLNESFFTRRPDVELRVYGFYSIPCDLSFLASMANVRRLSADCLHNASGIESIVALPRLDSLSIGIYNLEDLNFLKDVADGITHLFIGATKSKKPDLAPLAGLKQLTTLYLEGQRKNIEVIAELSNLEDITLRSITVPSVGFLKPLDKLWRLDIKLGGTKNLAALEGMARLKYLELWQINGMSDISVISSLVGLQYLFLQSLRRVTVLPDLRRLTKLRRIYLESMKGLTDVSVLGNAPALSEFIHIAANNLQPVDFLPLLQNQNVKKVRIGFGSDKKNIAFRAMMSDYGKELGEFEPFQFAD